MMTAVRLWLARRLLAPEIDRWRQQYALTDFWAARRASKYWQGNAAALYDVIAGGLRVDLPAPTVPPDTSEDPV